MLLLYILFSSSIDNRYDRRREFAATHSVPMDNRGTGARGTSFQHSRALQFCLFFFFFFGRFLRLSKSSRITQKNPVSGPGDDPGRTRKLSLLGQELIGVDLYKAHINSTQLAANALKLTDMVLS